MSIAQTVVDASGAVRHCIQVDNHAVALVVVVVVAAAVVRRHRVDVSLVIGR